MMACVKRLGRWAFNILAGVSLVLCLAFLVLWVRSYRGGHLLALRRADPQPVGVRGPLQLPPPVRYLSVELGWRDGVVRYSRGHVLHSHDAWQWLRVAGDSPFPEPGAGWRLVTLRATRRTPDLVAPHADDAKRFAGVARFRFFTKPMASAVTPHDITEWFIPHAHLVTLLGLPPSLWLVLAASRWRSRRTRRLGGLCLICGYDLRATPGRCPECGFVPAKGEVRDIYDANAVVPSNAPQEAAAAPPKEPEAKLDEKQELAKQRIDIAGEQLAHGQAGKELAGALEEAQVAGDRARFGGLGGGGRREQAMRNDFVAVREYVPMSLVAAIPGKYTAPASRAYLDYTDEFKHWVPGTSVTIEAKN